MTNLRRHSRSTRRSLHRKSKSSLLTKKSRDFLRHIGGADAPTKSVGSKPKPVYKVGQTVKWTWGGSVVYGVVTKVHLETAVLRARGHYIKMKGSPTRPVYEVEQESGMKLLKTAKQLQKSTKKLTLKTKSEKA